MKKVGLIWLILLVSMAVLGTSYAQWTQNLSASAATVAISSLSIKTNEATGVNSDSATLNGCLSGLGEKSPVAVSFDWGLDTSYSGSPLQLSPQVQNSTLVGPVAISLTGLTTDTTYHYRAKVTGYFVKYGSDMTFSTRQVLSITSATPLLAAFANQPYNTPVSASGGSGTGYSWSQSGSWPAWISLSSAGVISGTPAASDIGTSSFTAQVSDSRGNTATKLFSITVQN
jgi:hypothetical protein